LFSDGKLQIGLNYRQAQLLNDQLGLCEPHSRTPSPGEIEPLIDGERRLHRPKSRQFAGAENILDFQAQFGIGSITSLTQTPTGCSHVSLGGNDGLRTC
jgi:hypothetical protein